MIVAVGSVFAQSDDRVPTPKLPYLRDDSTREGSKMPQTETPQGAAVEMPYSRVFRDTEGYDVIKDVNPEPSDIRFGQGAVKARAQVVNGRFALPFTTEKVDPEKAELKISNFYLDIRSLSVSAIYTDNLYFNEFDRQEGDLVLTRLDFAVMIPITKRFRISAAGAVIYLPLENRAGFALFDPERMFLFDPLFHSQVAYDIEIGQWEVEIFDDFRVMQVPFGVQLSYSYFEGAFDENVRRARLSFDAGHRQRGPIYQQTDPNGAFGVGLIEARNLAGGRISRVVPTETRVEIGGDHSDIWYFGRDRDDLNGLIHERDRVYVNLISERQNFRFKPFFRYLLERTDQYDWEHDVRGGVKGPITDYIDFYGMAGHRWLDSGRDQDLYEATISHEISPLTWHSFSYNRSVTEPDRDREDRWIYRISHIIGDGLVGQMYGSYANYEDLDNTGSDTDEWRGGARLNFEVSPKTSMMLGSTYVAYHYINTKTPDSREWDITYRIGYKFSPTFVGSLTYRYVEHKSDRRGSSFYENHGAITLTKYF
jgi:hypothetical protein